MRAISSAGSHRHIFRGSMHASGTRTRETSRRVVEATLRVVLVAVVFSLAAGTPGRREMGDEGKQDGQGEGEEGVEAWVVPRVLRPLVQRLMRAKVIAAFHLERAASQGGAGTQATVFRRPSPPPQPRLPHLRTRQPHHACRALLAPGPRHLPPPSLLSQSGGPMPAPYVVTAPSASPQTTRYRAGQWQQQWQRRRCSLLPRPASRNNFSEQGEGERAREVATTAKRSGGERARRWLMDELGALGVDSREEKWGRREVGWPSLRQLRLRAVGRQAAGAVERQGELRAGRAPHPSPSSARLALPPLLLLSTNSSAERPQRDDLGAAWARAVVETQAEQSFIDTNMSGGGGIAGAGRQGHPGMEGVRRPQAGTGSIGSTRSTGSIGRRSASMDVSRRCWQSMPFSLTDASSSLGFPQHRQHGSAAVPTMVAAVAWWAAVWSAVTASAW
ncbi:unnamed protein product [Closterium sp. NIES-64]|nr:unnamed protein product [Closterium sp. NIES-64]